MGVPGLAQNLKTGLKVPFIVGDVSSQANSNLAFGRSTLAKDSFKAC